MKDIVGWLAALGLTKYEQIFVENEIDWAVLPKLTETDLKELGLPLGPRKKLLEAIAGLGESVSIAQPRGAREAERRHLTVMFCDLVGSTALAAAIDPEDLRQVIAVYQDAVATAVQRYDGFVAKFMGDGVLAYFGYPQAHEDDAERGVRAGLDLASAVPGLRPLGERVLACRIGIATGLVVMGDSANVGGASERAVVGETPNLAARLQDVAPPNGVVVAESTRRLLRDQFELSALGSQAIKGLSDPVAAWRVIGAGGAESRFAAQHSTGLGRFIGRDSEIALLLDRWDLAEGGEGQGVLLSGEAGIGKSRTCETLRERLAGRAHSEVQFQCSPYHANSALHPVLRHLERAAGIADADPPEVKLVKLEELLRRIASDVKPDTVGVLAHAFGLPNDRGLAEPSLSPSKEKERTLSLLIDVIIATSAQQPLLVLVEDVHWIDPTTQELLGLLINRLHELPILMLVTHRPEFVPPWGNHANVTRLAMNRLGQRQCAALVATITHGKTLPDEVVRQIIAKTDGIPLFVEELTKAVIESGLLVEGPDAFRLDGPLPPLAIPSSLHDSLMARLDRLATVKDIAQVGAAIGREFSRKLIAAVLGIDTAALGDSLDRLVAAELVFRRGAGVDAIYTFKHALIRDAAYDSMLKSRRQVCHRRIAAVLTDLDGGAAAATQPELVAYHHQEASDLERALKYWTAAGDLAERRAASREAAVHYQAAVALAEMPTLSANIRELAPVLGMKLGNALMQAEGYNSAAAFRAYLRAREVAAILDQPENYAKAGIGLAPQLFGGCRYHEALRILGEISESYFERITPQARVQLLTMLAVSNYGIGQYSTAWELVVSARALDDAAQCTHESPVGGGDPAIVARNYLVFGGVPLGYFESSLNFALEALAIAKTRNHPFSIAWALLTVSIVRNFFGQFGETIVVGDEARAICERHGFHARLGTVLMEMALRILDWGISTVDLSTCDAV